MPVAWSKKKNIYISHSIQGKNKKNEIEIWKKYIYKLILFPHIYSTPTREKIIKTKKCSQHEMEKKNIKKTI